MDQKHTDWKKTVDEVGRWTSSIKSASYGVPWASTVYPQARGRTPIFVQTHYFTCHWCIARFMLTPTNPLISLDRPQPPMVYSPHEVANS